MNLVLNTLYHLTCPLCYYFFIRFYRLVVMTARMQCYFRYRAHEPNPGRSMPQEWEQRYHRRPKARTQEFIEKMLVLKVSAVRSYAARSLE